MKQFLHLLLIAFMFFTCGVNSFAQNNYKPSKERGDPAKRTKGQLEGNQVRTTIQNFGLTGRKDAAPISDQTPYEWPKNTGKVYLAMTQLWVGGEVQDNDGKTIDVIDIANGRTSPAGASWNFEPTPGYYNDQNSANPDWKMANSVDNTTWPASWPDKSADVKDPGWKGEWNGYFGKNIFNADQELYYRASDDRYTRYNYFPDSTDQTRKGLGITFDSRSMAWSQVLVEDVVYLLYKIKNDGTKDIPKVAVSIWYADFVGGDGDSQDDISEFDLQNDIAWSHDRDNKAPTFGNDPVGAIGIAFLETPGNSVDRIDNDGDSPETGPFVTEDMLNGEIPDNGIDDNGNGLIDENEAHVAFGTQRGVVFADGIAQPIDPAWLTGRINFKVEANSPVVTQQMIDAAASDKWKRWPPNPETDHIQNGKIHLIMVTSDDLGLAFKDGIDNDGDGETGSPVVRQGMIDSAASDAPYFRFRVNDRVILYNVVQSTLGRKYADGIDNDNNGAVDEGIDDGIDVMIDESRSDGIDNSYDWNKLTDDVGLDGVPGTGDYGEGDGKPTSGARFGLPGEPNVDVTDVDETDQIGITTAQYVPAGSTNLNNDRVLWFDKFLPGKFYDPALITAGEYDLFVTSSFFPLKAGQTEPISLAVILANGPVVDPNALIRKKEMLQKKVRAQETYNNDYKFANAPLIPKVTAVTGDNKVTLYWDDIAEGSFDSYIAHIGGIGNDFEGYRIYRASDPAFEDAVQITSGSGVKKFKNPIKIFDKDDGIKGYFPVSVEGVQYYIGDDTGIQHQWADTTVQNGFTYYYAITSFDFGYIPGNITPSECPIRISVRSDGSVSLGQNVVKVRPEAPVAGYVAPTLGAINLVQGSTSGKVFYEVVDNDYIKNGHIYNITFQDTIKLGDGKTKPDTLTTKNFTLTDSTDSRIVLTGDNFNENYEENLVDGFRLHFQNEKSVELNKSTSRWSSSNIAPYILEKFTFLTHKGTQNPSDYKIVFGNVGVSTSRDTTINNNHFPPVPVNFTAYNVSSGKKIDCVFMEVDTTFGTRGMLSANAKGFKDRIVFIEPNAQGKLAATWWFYLNGAPDTAHGYRIPQAGDTAYLYLKKPFLSSDKFRFVAQAAKINQEQARVDLNRIQVVPNPYIANAIWEPKNPYVSGRGPRELHFTHLPQNCTIRIFTVNGELVNTIEHNSQLNDGTAVWNMLSRDNLSISYGVYVYHIDAPGIGEKIGKFAVIK